MELTDETKLVKTNIPIRILKIFSICNIFTIEDLCKIDIERIYRIRGLGDKSCNIILQFMRDNNLEFRN